MSTPDLRPSLNSILEGLAGDGYLGHLFTTVAFDRTRLSGKAMALMEKALPPGSRSKVRRRRVKSFLEGKVDTYWSREIIRLMASRFLSDTATHIVWEWAEKGFDDKYARRYAGQYRYLYGMEHSSLASFTAQKRLGGFCLLRQVNVHGRVLAETLRHECEKHPAYVTDYVQTVLGRMEAVIARKELEYGLADRVIANSDYVRRTFLEQGVAEEKVVAVPTGCPPVADATGRERTTDGPLTFLWVGTVSLRKGAPYLFEAWETLSGSTTPRRLVIAGRWEVPVPESIRGRGDVEILGAIDKDTLAQWYARAHVLVLPSLCEGLAHSLLEGLAHGLAVVTTPNSGCGSLVETGRNGFLIPAADTIALREALEQCLVKGPAGLGVFGRESAETARNWTVADSNLAHLKVVEQFMKDAADAS